jgi:cold shock CspA family protein
MTRGSVVEFSETRGIGVIEVDGSRYSFHCTQIADGTRTVRVGAPVEFEIVPGRRGDWEAAHIEKVDA